MRSVVSLSSFVSIVQNVIRCRRSTHYFTSERCTPPQRDGAARRDAARTDTVTRAASSGAKSAPNAAELGPSSKSQQQKEQKNQPQKTPNPQKQQRQRQRRGKGVGSRINTKLFSAGNSDRIAEIVAGQRGVFSAMNVTVALRELAKMKEGEMYQRGSSPAGGERRAVLIVELEAIVEQHAGRLTPYQLATCLWSFAKLGGCPAPLLSTLLGRAEALLPALTDVQLSKLLWSLGRMQHRPEGPLLAAAAQLVEQRAGQLAPQGLANVAWAFARLHGREGHEAMLGAIAREASAKLDDFSAQGLSNLAWAFAALRYDLGQGLLKQLEHAALTRLRDFSAQGVATTMWALTEMGHMPRALLAEVSRQADVFFSYCSPTDACMALVAVGRTVGSDAGISSDGSGVPSSSAADSSGGSSSYDAVGGDASVFEGDASVGGGGESGEGGDEVAVFPLVDYLLDRLQSGGAADGLKPEEVAGVMWVLGKLRYRPGQAMQPLVAAMSARAHSLSGQSLANVVWAMGRLNSAAESSGVGGGVGLDLELQKLLLEQVQRPQHFAPQHLANIAWASAQLDPPAECRTALVCAATQAADRVEELRPSEASVILWALAKLGMGTAPPPPPLPPPPPPLPEYLKRQTPAVPMRSIGGVSAGGAIPFGDRADEAASAAVAGVAGAGSPWWAAPAEETPEGEVAARLLRGTGERYAVSSPGVFNDCDVTLLLWAAARLGRRLPPAAEQSAAQWLVEGAARLPTRQLAMAAWAVARMGPPMAERQEVLDAVVGGAAGRADGLAPQDLANLVHSLGKLGYCPDQVLLDSLAETAGAQLPLLSPDELVNTVWGFAMLGHHPGALLGRVAKHVEETCAPPSPAAAPTTDAASGGGSGGIPPSDLARTASGSALSAQQRPDIASATAIAAVAAPSPADGAAEEEEEKDGEEEGLTERQWLLLRRRREVRQREQGYRYKGWHLATLSWSFRRLGHSGEDVLAAGLARAEARWREARAAAARAVEADAAANAGLASLAEEVAAALSGRDEGGM